MNWVMRVALGLVAVTVLVFVTTWPRPWDAWFGRAEGAACVVLGDREGVIFGGNCLPFYSANLRVELTDETSLADLAVFTELEALTLQIRSPDVDLAELLLHPRLRYVRIMGLRDAGGLSLDAAELDLSPLRGLPDLNSLQFDALRDVDMRLLEEIDMLVALQLVDVSTEHLPGMDRMALVQLELSGVELPAFASMGPMESLRHLELRGMPDMYPALPLLYPNLQRLEISGDLSHKDALAQAIRDLEQLTFVSVPAISAGRIPGRDNVLRYLEGSGD